MITFNQVTKLLFISILAALMGIFNSCKPYGHEDDIKSIDSMMHIVELSEESMIFDEEVIKQRKDSIELKFELVQEKLVEQDRFDTEMQFLLSDYKAMGKNYKNFLENYGLLKFETEEHRNRLNNLKRDIKEGNLTDEDIDSIISNEWKIIREHYEKVKDITATVGRIERNYQRQNEKVNKLYNSFTQEKEADKN